MLSSVSLHTHTFYMNTLTLTNIYRKEPLLVAGGQNKSDTIAVYSSCSLNAAFRTFMSSYKSQWILCWTKSKWVYGHCHYVRPSFVCVYRCGGGLVYTVKSSKSELNSNTSFTESIECNLSETVNRTGIQYNHTRLSQLLAGPTKCRA